MIQKSEKLLKILTSAILILLIACTVSLVMLLIRGIDPDVKTIDVGDKDDENNSGYILGLTPDYGQSYIDSMIFVCDSTFADIGSHDLLTKELESTQIWTNTVRDLPLEYTIDSATVIFPETNEEMSISSAASIKKPAYIVITVGLNNGVPHCTEESFKEYYSKLVLSIRDASPDTRIILQSIFPVSRSTEKNTPNISNAKIDTANGWIEEIAEELSVRYLDTASILKDAKGSLSSKYDGGDGIHLNKNGYAKALEYIRTHGYK